MRKIIDLKKYDKIIGWGTGDYYLKIAHRINVKLDFLVDKDKAKQGIKIDGIDVFNPQTIKLYDDKKILIIVFSMYYEEIISELKSIGNCDYIAGKELLEIKSVDIEINNINTQKGMALTICRNNFMEELGGTSKFIREQMIILNNHDIDSINIYWKKVKLYRKEQMLIFILFNGQRCGAYTLDDFIKKFKYNIDTIIINNLINLDFNMLDSILDRIKYNNIIYYIHDFSCICSNIKMIYNNEFFCDSINENWKLCNSCIENEKRKLIYNYHKKLFNRENIVLICPSENTKKYIEKAFPLAKSRIDIIPHFKFKTSNRNKNDKNNKKKLRIAYVGYKHKQKGWDVFKELVNKFKDDYEFYCLGKTDEHIDGVKEYSVSFIEDGKFAMINKLKKYDIDIGLLWSTCPETYSYTYYECYAANVFVITNKLSGNINDQVLKNNNGISCESEEELFELLENESSIRKYVNNNSLYIYDIINNEEFIKYILH